MHGCVKERTVERADRRAEYNDLQSVKEDKRVKEEEMTSTASLPCLTTVLY